MSKPQNMAELISAVEQGAELAQQRRERELTEEELSQLSGGGPGVGSVASEPRKKGGIGVCGEFPVEQYERYE